MTQDEFIVGDKVEMFALPDGRTFISKVDQSYKDAYTIGRVTPAHIYFSDDISIETS